MHQIRSVQPLSKRGRQPEVAGGPSGINDVPEVVLAKILGDLDLNFKASVALLVCRRWHQLLRMPRCAPVFGALVLHITGGDGELGHYVRSPDPGPQFLAF